MKQVIVLCAMIALGIIMVLAIQGDGGLLDAMKALWKHEASIRICLTGFRYIV